MDSTLLLRPGGWWADTAITPADLKGVGGIVAFILGAVVLYLYRRSVTQSRDFQSALEQRTQDVKEAYARERAELIDQRDQAIKSRDSMTQTFHDFVRADRDNSLEAFKRSNQLAEELLARDETRQRELEQVKRELEWERRNNRGDH